MAVPLRVLIVEDSVDDSELVVRQLRRADFDVTSRRVEDESGLREALDSVEWDIVLADYSLPGFSGMEAIRIVHERDADLPLVLVSGAIDVPTALAAMKAGAKDFVLKGEPERLPSVIDREIYEAEQRKKRRRAEQQRDMALDELRKANEQLTAFARIFDVPLCGATPQLVLEDLLGRLATIIGVDGAAVMLLRDDGILGLAGAVGPLAEVANRVRGDSGFASTIVSENTAIYIRDADSDERVDCAVTRSSGIRSILGVPMHLGGEVAGVLHVHWCEVYEPPTWKAPLLELAADSCAMTIENARLFEHERVIAETLQGALLTGPSLITGLEVGHIFSSATVDTMVGGDFYDVFELELGRAAFSIGDVSGKGLAAASVTSLTKNALRALAVEGNAPDVAMLKCNDVVFRFTGPETFVTGAFGHIDVNSGAVTFCNAGHALPVVVGPDGSRFLSEHSVLLGALADVDYSSARAQLAPGESLVLYTDGLTEARNSQGEFFGEEGLSASLEKLGDVTPQRIAAHLFDEVLEFSNGRLRDDVAVLVLRPHGGE